MIQRLFKTIILISGLSFFYSPLLAVAQKTETQSTTLEVAFVKDMTKQGISFLANENATLEQRKTAFRKLLRDGFDMHTIAQFAVGPYWKTMTGTQKKAYLKEFEDYTVNLYSHKFQDYNGQTLAFDENISTIGKDVIVSSTLTPQSGNNISIEWRVRNKGGQFKIIDIVVAGVSMTITQRSDFSSTIQRGGGNIDTLISNLAEKNRQE